MNPPFVMSKYASQQDLLKDKAAYYEQLARTLAANANNPKLSDAEFRQVVRNSIPEFAETPQAPDMGAACVKVERGNLPGQMVVQALVGKQVVWQRSTPVADIETARARAHRAIDAHQKRVAAQAA